LIGNHSQKQADYLRQQTHAVGCDLFAEHVAAVIVPASTFAS
jgi:hypothetical protein